MTSPESLNKTQFKLYHVTQENYTPGQIIDATPGNGTYAVTNPEEMTGRVRMDAKNRKTEDKPIHTYEVKPNSYRPWAQFTPSGKTRYSDKRGMTIVGKTASENITK